MRAVRGLGLHCACMTIPWPYWALVLLMQIVWAIALPGRQAKLIAAIGAAAALAAIAAQFWPRHAGPGMAHTASRRASTQAAALTPPLYAAALLPFLLPILSFVSQPRVFFYWLDGRAWLIVAWLIVSAWALHTTGTTSHAGTAGAIDADGHAESPESGHAHALPLALFLLWTSIFWLTAVWDLGIREFILNYNIPNDRVALTRIFQVWDTHPVSEHLFLAWRLDDAFEKRVVYVNHVHPYLMSMYAWVSLVRAATGLPLQTARFAVPLLYMLVMLVSTTTLLARMNLLRRANTVRTQVVLFLAFGFLITTWRFWRDQFWGSADDTFPLEAGILVLVYASLVAPARPRLALISSALFVAMAPIHLPVLILLVVCLFGEAGTSLRDTLARNRLPVRILLVATIVGVIVQALPNVLVAWNGITAVGSSLMFRSGLDGDTTYVTSMWQAVWAPTVREAYRSPDTLFLPSFVPLAIAVPWMWRTRDPEGARLRHLSLFMITPYLTSLIFFPQAVSIHPYMFDLFLILPVVVASMAFVLMAPIQRRIAGGGLLVFLLIAAALLMANLMALAQFLRLMTPR